MCQRSGGPFAQEQRHSYLVELGALSMLLNSFAFLFPLLETSTFLLLSWSRHSWGQERELKSCGFGKSIITHNASLVSLWACGCCARQCTKSQALPLSTGGESLCRVEELAKLRCLRLCPGSMREPSRSTWHR